MKNNNVSQKPIGTIEERLARLQLEFPSNHISVLLNLTDDNVDRKKVLEHYVDALERTEAFAKNGNSCEGLWFNFEKVSNLKIKE